MLDDGTRQVREKIVLDHMQDENRGSTPSCAWARAGWSPANVSSG